MVAHVPGLKVMFPATPYDAKGMLNLALRGTDPALTRKALGWKPKVGVEQLARMMVESDLELARREKTLRDAGNRDVTLRVFAERNHLLLADPVGFPGGYTKLKDGHIGGDVMGPIADWVALKLGAPAPTP
mgnify:CR=1 FL=1